MKAPKGYYRVPFSNIAYAPGLRAWVHCTAMTIWIRFIKRRLKRWG